MIVVDTNIIGYLFLTSEWSSVAEEVFRRDPEWAAPLLWRSELRNVLALYLRKRLLTLDDAQRIMAAAHSLMLGREFDIPSEDVLRLAALGHCSAYDCEFVSLALFLDVPLVTMDRKIQKAFPSIALSPRTFLDS